MDIKVSNKGLVSNNNNVSLAHTGETTFMYSFNYYALSTQNIEMIKTDCCFQSL